MWTCPKCNRIFKKAKQPHSCKTVSLDQHFISKEIAKELFDYLVNEISSKIGKCQVISIPFCIHFFGKYDFLAALPKKDKLEIRFCLSYVLNSPRLTQSVPVSSKDYKNCLNLYKTSDIDNDIIKWLGESYHLKN